MTAPDLIHEAETESKIALVLYVDGKQGDGKEPGRQWRDAYVQGYMRALAPRSEDARQADIERLVMKERRAHNRPRTDPATPSRRKGDAAEAAAIAAHVEAEAQRARDRDLERRQRATAHEHSEVKP